MRKTILSVIVLAALASCSKDDNPNPGVKPYTVPTTYNFSNAAYLQSTQHVKMTVELDTYLKLANTGSALVPLDQARVNNMYNNTNSPFTEAALNNSGINQRDLTSDAALYKSFADSVLLYNTGATATAGTGGFIARGSNKIIVGPRGLEYGQAFPKGIMGGLYFKEAVKLLTEVKAVSATDTVAAQTKWDQAFGYLPVPANYDSSVTYASTDPSRPLLWGGYLAERGKAIQAGGTIFGAFLKGRAAISGYDLATRDAQVDIILNKWEQLAAAAALNYFIAPTQSTAVGNYGTQLHALSEAHGFIAALKYRASTSKLTAANFATLNNIMNTNFYTLLGQTGFTDLVAGQNILKSTYGL